MRAMRMKAENLSYPAEGGCAHAALERNVLRRRPAIGRKWRTFPAANISPVSFLLGGWERRRASPLQCPNILLGETNGRRKEARHIFTIQLGSECKVSAGAPSLQPP